MIVGLPGDSKISITESIDKVIAEKLLWGLQIYPLIITKSSTLTDNYFLSDLDKNPEKFGVTTGDPFINLNGDKETITLNWETDWINAQQAMEFTAQLESKYSKQILFMNHFEYAGFYSLKLISQNKTINYPQLKHQAYNVCAQIKQNYIQDKLSRYQL